MTQQYLAGELSVLLARLHTAAGTSASASDIARLRQLAEIAPLEALTCVAKRALELIDVVCWESLTGGDTAAFSRQAAIGAQLHEFGICACLLAED